MKTDAMKCLQTQVSSIHSMMLMLKVPMEGYNDLNEATSKRIGLTPKDHFDKASGQQNREWDHENPKTSANKQVHG